MGAAAVKDWVDSTASFYQVEKGMILDYLYPSMAKRHAHRVRVEEGVTHAIGTAFDAY
jgi:hypothetical protein